MAFTDMPAIDRSSINSETSTQRFKDIINLKSGFQVRVEWPDTGCDLNIELILDGRGASSQIFPVQLKSIEKFTLVKDKAYISYSFETSRLRYLMRRLPAMGIVVLYSVEENKCFSTTRTKFTNACWMNVDPMTESKITKLTSTSHIQRARNHHHVILTIVLLCLFFF